MIKCKLISINNKFVNFKIVSLEEDTNLFRINVEVNLTV